MSLETSEIVQCHACGLSQLTPDGAVGLRIVCARCGVKLQLRAVRCSWHVFALPLVLSALILYPFGVGMPMLTISRLGHSSATSVLGGVEALFGGGHVVIGVVVLLCSVVFPLGKLLSMLLLLGGRRLNRHHRAFTYRLVEFTGRWGMLDVLLVALMVAVVKLGDFVEVKVGPAALAFASCVVLSLLASWSFDPHRIWKEDVR